MRVRAGQLQSLVPAAGEGTGLRNECRGPSLQETALLGALPMSAWQGPSPQMVWARPVPGFPLASSLHCAEETSLALQMSSVNQLVTHIF